MLILAKYDSFKFGAPVRTSDFSLFRAPHRTSDLKNQLRTAPVRTSKILKISNPD